MRKTQLPGRTGGTPPTLKDDEGQRALDTGTLVGNAQWERDEEEVTIPIKQFIRVLTGSDEQIIEPREGYRIVIEGADQLCVRYRYEPVGAILSADGSKEKPDAV